MRSTDEWAARSKIVLGTIVTGIPSHTVTSSPGRVTKWRRMSVDDLLLREIATSIGPEAESRMPQSAAAERWLKAAPEPDESTAAIHFPCADKTR